MYAYVLVISTQITRPHTAFVSRCVPFSAFVFTHQQNADPLSLTAVLLMIIHLLTSQSALSYSPPMCFQTAETPLAELPELPSAQLGLSSAPDQLPVCAADESAAEALPSAAHRSAGKAHPNKQTWLQLVSGLTENRRLIQSA